MLRWRWYLFFIFIFASPLQADQSWQTQLENAKALEKKGSYLEARQIYEKVVKKAQKKHYEGLPELQKNLETLNLKLLFSDLKTEDSDWHEVKEGETLGEIASKYKTTIGLIKKSNGLDKSKIYPGQKLKVTTKPFWIEVDQTDHVLKLMQGKKEIKHYLVATGRHHKTPKGEFQIVVKLENPTWYKTGAAPIPPNSPENGLGTRWMGFDKAKYGIHGTISPEKIGTYASAGCVRMLNQDVEELFLLVPVGTKVKIKE